MDIDEPKSEQTDKTLVQSNEDKKFLIKKWHAVTLWTWDICVENCAICRNHIMELCIEAQADGGAGGTNATCDTPCNVAWGVCSHAFHFCCIRRWLKTRSVCPLCSKDWDYARVGKNSS